MASLTQRMLGAAKLDAATYEEVEADTTATPQAMLVVVLASVAAGFGVLRVVGVGGLLMARPGFADRVVRVGLHHLLRRDALPARDPRRRRTWGSSCGPSASPPLRG